MTDIDDLSIDDLFNALTRRIENETGRPAFKEHGGRYFFEQGIRAGRGLPFTMAENTGSDGKPVDRTYAIPAKPLPARYERPVSDIADTAEAVKVTEGQRKALELVNEGLVAERVYGDSVRYSCLPGGGRPSPQQRTIDGLFTAGLVRTSNRTHRYGGWALDLTPRGHATLTSAAKPDIATTLSASQHKALHLVATDTIYMDGHGSFQQDWRTLTTHMNMPTYPTFASIEEAGLAVVRYAETTSRGTFEESTPVRLTDAGKALLAEKGPYRGL
jgi:hypothetical protein